MASQIGPSFFEKLHHRRGCHSRKDNKLRHLKQASELFNVGREIPKANTLLRKETLQLPSGFEKKRHCAQRRLVSLVPQGKELLTGRFVNL